MKKVTCDRCNDAVRFSNGGEVILRPAREPLDIFSYDLCQPCLAGLRDYLTAAPQDPDTRAWLGTLLHGIKG